MKYVLLFVVLIIIGCLILLLATNSIDKCMCKLGTDKRDYKNLPFFHRIWHSLLMGLACFEGLMTRKLGAETATGDSKQLEEILPIEGNIFTAWGIFGLYLFVLVLFLPVVPYLICVSAVCVSLYLLKNRTSTQIISLMVCLLLIKFSLFILIFAASHFPHTSLSVGLAEAVPFVHPYVEIVLIGMALSIICRSLAAPIILTRMIMEIGNIDLTETVLMLAGVHFGLCLYFWVASFMSVKLHALKEKKRSYCLMLGVVFIAVAIPIGMVALNGTLASNWLLITGIVALFTLISTSIFALRPRLNQDSP